MSVPIEFLDQNPWWRDRKAIDEDRYIKARKASTVPWEPRLQHTFALDEDIIYSLRGPRQVGKTTLLKEIIRDLLGRGVEKKKYEYYGSKANPRAIFYYSCDLIGSSRALVETLSRYLDRAEKTRNRRLYVFLDEISSVKNWQQGIKHLADMGKLENVTMILTGSHTIDIKKSIERLPGRRGRGEDVPDKILLPMKFSEYVETLSKQIAKAMHELKLLSWKNRQTCIEALARGKLPSAVEELALYSRELETLFSDYMLTGGIPRVIDEYRQKGSISESTYKTYVDAVIGDLQRWKLGESYVRQVIRRVLETLGDPVGWSTLQRGTEIASHNTVGEYVERLKETFTLTVLYQLNTARYGPMYQKEKKLHFHDPFFLHSMRAWEKGGDPFEETVGFLKDTEAAGKLAESIVVDHAIRCAFGFSPQKSLFSYENAVFYWRSKKRREVDLVIRLNSQNLPIEVKFQPKIVKADKYGIIDFLKTGRGKGGIILTKGETRADGRITALPVWLFLSLI